MSSVIVVVIVGVSDDQAAPGEDEHGDVPSHDVPVEGRLQVDQVGPHGVASESGSDHVTDHGRVVAGPLDVGDQVTRQDGRHVRSRWHSNILPHTPHAPTHPLWTGQVSERLPGSARRGAGATVISAPRTSIPPA